MRRPLALGVSAGQGHPGPGSGAARWACHGGNASLAPGCCSALVMASSGLLKEVGVTCESDQETAANHLCVLGQVTAFLPQHPYLQKEGV